MRLILMGPPGAGKGTQAKFIAEHFGDPGDLDRRHLPGQRLARAPPLGLEAKRYMDAGEYVPDEVTNLMVRDRLDEPDAGRGFLLDGYPRTLRAGRGARRDDRRSPATALDAVVVLTVDEDEIVQRLLAARRRSRAAPTTPRTSSGAARRSTPSRPRR